MCNTFAVAYFKLFSLNLHLEVDRVLLIIKTFKHNKTLHDFHAAFYI